MALETITREEFDKRLEQSTEQMRQKRLALEAQAVVLEDLIAQYSSALEHLEAVSKKEIKTSSQRRNDLKNLLTELAKRTSAIADTL